MAGVLAAWSEPFGRYGLATGPADDFFEISDDGFRFRDPLGDRFAFESPIRDLKAKRINWYEALYQGQDYALTPGAIRSGGFQPGFQLYFPLGLRFRFSTNLSPFLTWGEGTVDSDNPTAPSRWALVSFQESQPPVLLIFDQPVQLITTGQSGSWTMTTMERFKGWVRVVAPFGKRKMGATVGSLGSAVQQLKAFLPGLLAQEPVLVSREVREEEGMTTAIWTFDRPGAMLPRPLLLAKAGGYDVRLLTGVSKERMELETGPVQWSTEPRIAVRFPMVRVPVGRSLAVGEPGEGGPSTASAFDLPSVVELALANLTSGRETEAGEVISQVREEYERSLNLVQVPGTSNWTPVGTEGIGIDLVAAHGFLNETVIGAGGVSDATNAPFWGAADRLDWQTWGVWATNGETGRRAAALLALAGVVSQDPERRLMGAMAQAGLAADSAMSLYAERRRFERVVGTGIDPLAALRRAAYRVPGGGGVSVPYLDSLVSEVRVLSPVKVVTTKVAGGYLVSWEHRANAPRSLTLLTGYPVEIEAKENLAGIKPSSSLGMTSLTFEPRGEGICQILLRLPSWAKPLPEAAAPPRYSE